MIQDEILKLNPGPKLNALVAILVMEFDETDLYEAPLLKWSGRYIYKHDLDDAWFAKQKRGEWEYCGPRYSTNISDSFGVVLKLSALGYRMMLYQVLKDQWKCCFRSKDIKQSLIASGKTAPEAISKAAILIHEKTCKGWYRVSLKIDTNTCGGCGECKEICPVGNVINYQAMSDENDYCFVANKDNCPECGACVEACPTKSITLE